MSLDMASLKAPRPEATEATLLYWLRSSNLRDKF